MIQVPVIVHGTSRIQTGKWQVGLGTAALFTAVAVAAYKGKLPSIK